MVNYDIASHNGLAAVGLGAVDALLAKTLDGFAKHVNSLRGRIALAFFFNEFLNFAGNHQNICHVCLHSVRIKD